MSNLQSKGETILPANILLGSSGYLMTSLNDFDFAAKKHFPELVEALDNTDEEVQKHALLKDSGEGSKHLSPAKRKNPRKRNLLRGFKSVMVIPNSKKFFKEPIGPVHEKDLTSFASTTKKTTSQSKSQVHKNRPSKDPSKRTKRKSSHFVKKRKKNLKISIKKEDDESWDVSDVEALEEIQSASSGSIVCFFLCIILCRVCVV